MVPSVFQHLQPYVVGHGITEMIKRVVYGVGDPYWQGFLLMFAYAIIGVVAMFVGKRWREAKEVDRILHGKPTMVAAAQGAMMQHAMAARAATLEHHGMGPTEPTADSTDDSGPSNDPARPDDAAFDDIEASMTRDPFLNNGIGDGFSEVEREYEVRHSGEHEHTDHEHGAKHSH
jgi:xanthosine utilization system XapX-like protein